MALDGRGADRAMNPCLNDGLRRSHAVGCSNNCSPCPGARARECADRQRTGGPLWPWHAMAMQCSDHRVPRLRARVCTLAQGTRCSAPPVRRPPADGRPAPAFAGGGVAVQSDATQHVLRSVAWRGAQRRVNRETTDGRLARAAQHRQEAPRGQGGQPLALRLNDQLGLALASAIWMMEGICSPTRGQPSNWK